MAEASSLTRANTRCYAIHCIMGASFDVARCSVNWGGSGVRTHPSASPHLGLAIESLSTSTGTQGVQADYVDNLRLINNSLQLCRNGDAPHHCGRRIAAAGRRCRARSRRIGSECEGERPYSPGKILLQARNVDSADHFFADAQGIIAANNRQLAAVWRQRVKDSDDPAHAMTILTSLSESDFADFRDRNKVPAMLDMGFQVLTDRAVATAKPQLAAATALRHEQQKRMAAEAAERARQELADAEIKRKAAEAQQAAERAKAEAAQKEIKGKLDAYSTALQSAEVAIVDRVAVRRSGDIWTVTLTVGDIWHIHHKQIRLQDTQNLWKLWALVASPKDPDKARISIVDQNGNEVGGSGILGIWVQD